MFHLAAGGSEYERLEHESGGDHGVDVPGARPPTPM